MFAGAAREAVFSKAGVVRRVNNDFIPVALKAGLINNPPRGMEGDLYAEISRSKPAPQGICVANSAGKVLDWVLMFDDDRSVVKFLDHTLARYAEYPDAEKRVPAERFMRFPSQKLDDVDDKTGKLEIVGHHSDERCPAKPTVAEGTLVGRVIGRALDKDGKPVADTLRQEHYMEARFEVPVKAQASFCKQLQDAGKGSFRVSNDFVSALVGPAFLGQLDVHPGGGITGSKNDRRQLELNARRVVSQDSSLVRVHLTGNSDLAGSQDQRGKNQDGRLWEHEVKLNWEAFADVDVEKQRIVQLVAVARGNEKLRWGDPGLQRTREADVAHLPAGHAIDLECGVRYGLFAEPAPKEEVGEPARRQPTGPPASLTAKMQKLQQEIRRWQKAGRDPSDVGKLMQAFGPLVKHRKFKEAETLIDVALELLGK